jgi:hypothetical protein
VKRSPENRGQWCSGSFFDDALKKKAEKVHHEAKKRAGTKTQPKKRGLKRKMTKAVDANQNLDNNTFILCQSCARDFKQATSP